MATESCFASLSCFVSIFLTNYLDFTKTIIPLALMGYSLRPHSGSRNTVIVNYYTVSGPPCTVYIDTEIYSLKRYEKSSYVNEF